MEFDGAHIFDENLLPAADGELPGEEAAPVRRRLTACRTCRARQDIEEAIAVCLRVHRRNLDSWIPPAAGPRALLDIHNLWPVCRGRLDLAAAQPDISANWIAAYRKYFQTGHPLETANP